MFLWKCIHLFRDVPHSAKRFWMFQGVYILCQSFTTVNSVLSSFQPLASSQSDEEVDIGCCSLAAHHSSVEDGTYFIVHSGAHVHFILKDFVSYRVVVSNLFPPVLKVNSISKFSFSSGAVDCKIT